jgi:transposase
VVLEWVAELVTEGLCQRMQPLLPQPPRDDRAALAGIVHVLITGCIWTEVATVQFGCSGATC